MSGGSLNYLCYKEPEELFHYIDEMEEVEQVLIGRGAEDIAKDVRRLIERIKCAENHIGVLSEQLSDIFHAVEWRLSADYGEDDLMKHIEQYRARNWGWETYEKDGVIHYRCLVCKTIYAYVKNGQHSRPYECRNCGAHMKGGE